MFFESMLFFCFIVGVLIKYCCFLNFILFNKIKFLFIKVLNLSWLVLFKIIENDKFFLLFILLFIFGLINGNLYFVFVFLFNMYI